MPIRFNDTQLVLLSAASQRDDHCLIPPAGPKRSQVRRAVAKLPEAGLMKEIRAKAGAPVWRRDDETAHAYALKLTAAGLKAIAVDETPPSEEEGERRGGVADPEAEIGSNQAATVSRPDSGAARTPMSPRGGTKIAEVIELLQPRQPPTESEVRNAIERVTVRATRIEIVLSESIASEEQDRRLTFPWTKPSSHRRPAIIQSIGEEQQSERRAMRTKARDSFVKALRASQRWLDELLSDSTQSVKSLAVRERKSKRAIRMTLTLAFLSPVLIEAAMDGRLPRGFSFKRLTDLPMLWSEQWSAVGLREPIQVRAELG